MIAAFQTLKMSWPKNKRGAEFACERSEIPKVYPVDGEQPHARNHVFHLDTCKEGILSELDGYALSYDDGQVWLRFLKIDSYGDGSRRSRIDTNEWIQILYNFRFIDDEGAWYFGEGVINAGKFRKLNYDIFLRGNPAKVCDLRKHRNSLKPYTNTR